MTGNGFKAKLNRIQSYQNAPLGGKREIVNTRGAKNRNDSLRSTRPIFH